MDVSPSTIASDTDFRTIGIPISRAPSRALSRRVTALNRHETDEYGTLRLIRLSRIPVSDSPNASQRHVSAAVAPGVLIRLSPQEVDRATQSLGFTRNAMDVPRPIPLKCLSVCFCNNRSACVFSAPHPFHRIGALGDAPFDRPSMTA